MRDEARDTQLDAALRDVMKTPTGRRVIAWICRIANSRTSVTMSDPILMAAASGRRDVALAIEAMLEEADPDAYDLMIKEMRNDERRNEHHH